MEASFQTLLDSVTTLQKTVERLAEKIELIESIGGGGGSASIEDYESGQLYTRNMLVVDKNTETVYRVLSEEYTSVTVDDDVENGHLKLVGFESSIVTFPHNPTQAEIDALPDDTLVAVYSSMDNPYVPER